MSLLNRFVLCASAVVVTILLSSLPGHSSTVTITFGRYGGISCPAGKHCCSQQAMKNVDDQGDAIVDLGDFVEWIFPTPDVSVKFPGAASVKSPFAGRDHFNHASDRVTSNVRVRTATPGMVWKYKNLTWDKGSNSCDLVENRDHPGTFSPPGIVMRPPQVPPN
jgi:hypothetical protein